MKNLFLKTLAICLFLLVLPICVWGQQVNNHIIELELEKIESPDLRYCILANIANDSNFEYTIDEENNSVLLFSAEHWNDTQFQSYFDQTMSDIQSEFNAYIHAPKAKQGETFTNWKSSLPQDFFVLLFRLMLIENSNSRDGNQHCIDSDPFCTTDVVNFHVDGSASGVCESGPDYGCMSPYTARPPFWFHMKIGVAGTFTIRITNSNNLDLDFCAWGPFTDPTSPCPSQLTSGKIIDCDSPSNTVQECTIPSNAQVGQYYIMVITKYSPGSTDITFQKKANSGPGETDCGILPPLVNNDGPYCVNDNIRLTANGQSGASYHWTGPNNFNSNQQNPTINNCNLSHAGSYTCTISLNGQTNNASTEVQVYARPTANFTAQAVCQGNTTRFNNTSTTNPANQAMTYEWDFGDGNTSTQQSPGHQYVAAGNYNVTLTASCGNGACTSTKTQSVTVYPSPVADAGQDQTVVYNGVANLRGSGGGNGTFNYHWEPANKVVNPNSQNTQTVQLQQTTTFTLTVTHPQGGCTSTDQVNVLVSGSNMTATASATPNSICLGESSQLQATAVGGTGNFTYSWSPTIGLSSPIIANPVAHPTETTTYTCVVSDGMGSQSVSTTVTVNNPEYEDVEQYICPGDSYTFYGQDYSEEGNYPYYTTTAQGCEKIITLHLHHYPTYPNAHTTTESICHGTSYLFHGHYYSTSGMYSETLETIHGCDSVVWLNLTVYPENPVIVDNQSICSSQSLTWLDGNVYNQDGDEAFYDSIDNHGCLQVYQLHLSVGDYQTPPNYDPRRYECVPYDGEPNYHWYIAGVVDRYYTEDTRDTVIGINPDPNGCDFEYTLDLRFHRQFHEENNVTDCDSYTWEPEPNVTFTYNHSGTYTYPIDETVAPGFICPGEYVLNLTINDSGLVEDQFTGCDSYTWEYGLDHDTITYFESGNYEQITTTSQGCTLVNILHLQLDYSPNFPRVEGNPWVVGGSEFQYTIEPYWIDTHPKSTHQTEWGLYKPDGTQFTKWDLNVYDNGDKCLLYIYTFERDSIELRAHTTSPCGCGEFTHSKWIHCSYQDVEETSSMCEAAIYPNPNDGNMTLSFDNMMGEVVVKVYDITGTLVDNFTVYNGYGHQTHSYQTNRLSRGIYYFNLAGKDVLLTKKVIIID